MDALQVKIRQAIEQYYDTGDTILIKDLINTSSNIYISTTSEYPDYHRIKDIRIDTIYLRICRQISDGENIFLEHIGKDAYSKEEGVPIWLTGSQLRCWAEDENAEASKEAVDWSKYKD